MKVGYRRYSGKAFLAGNKVTSTRGAWLEKRIAFIDLLKSRGHEVTIINTGDAIKAYDVTFIEFGSSNYLFYKEDIDYTNALPGPKIFLCDDPELFNNVEAGAYWVNAENEQACTQHFGVPCETFPFFGLQKIHNYAGEKFYNGELPSKVVYYGGTSQGREERLNKYRVVFPLPIEVYGKEKDYKTITPKKPPTQEERVEFYRQFAYCLGMNDTKHKKLGWYTGRIYHAICAGTPVLFEHCWREDIKKPMPMLWGEQVALITNARDKCIAKLEQYGL